MAREIMKGMIFAAGLGTRLAPFTYHHPKALVEVGGVPMLERVILRMRDAGICHIVVNVHHFADQIVDFLKANDNFGLNIQISDESNLLLDTGGGLRKAAECFMSVTDPGAPILLHNADVLTDVDFNAMLSMHRSTDADVTLLCVDRESSRTLWFDSRSGLLQGWENKKDNRYKPEGFVPDTGSQGQSPFCGVHIIEPSSVFPLLEKQYPHHTPFSMIPFYLQNTGTLKMHRFMLPQGCCWFDVGSNEKVQRAEQFLRNQ